MREPYIVSALLALKPGAEWTIRGDNYSDLEWLDKSQTKPTEDEVNTKVTDCLLYTSPSPRDLSTSRMPSSA